MTTLSAILLTAALAAAQTAGKPAAYHLDDPANLAGERVSAPALADTLPINHGAAALQQLLLKLRTRASLMLIVAHPDDEDGGMLTYESRGQGARVAMLTLNRGEGGQNLMTGDFNDALGLIRTQELLAADRYMGVDQFFGSVVDFGFSKAREEALEQWGHDRVLYDAVRAVRLYRPLIVASVFVGGPTDGHGQHQVAGQMAQEVFNAAADPKVFPEMGLPPWAPLKVYARARGASNDPRGIYDVTTGQYQPARYMNYVTGVAASTPPPPAVIVHEGDVSTALGMNGDTYSQFARKGLALQKSQNGGGGGGRGGGGGGPVDAAYARYGSRVPNSPATESSFFDGIDTSVEGIATLAPHAPSSLRATLASVSSQFARAQGFFEQKDMSGVASALYESFKGMECILATLEDPQPMEGMCKLDGLQQWLDLPAEERASVRHEVSVKYAQADQALALALGIEVDAVSESHNGDIVLGSPARVKVHVTTTSTEPLEFVRTELYGAKEVWGRLRDPPPTRGVPIRPLAPFTAASAIDDVIDVPAKATSSFGVTRPYFTRPGIEQAYYDVWNPNLRNAAQTPTPMVVRVNMFYRLHPLVILSEIHDGLRPISLVPPASVSLLSPVQVLTESQRSLLVTLKVDPPATRVEEESIPANWKITPDIETAKAPGVKQFRLDIPAKGRTAVTFRAVAVLRGGQEVQDGFRSVGYPGLVSTNYFTPATERIVPLDLHMAPNLKVAYFQGTGDDVPAYLPDIGITPTILALSDLTAEKLAQYDAVVLGIRAYSAHAELAGAGSKPLLEYAKNGGVVIVQYNNGRYGAEDAPYPITTPLASQDHAHDVVVEAQPVAVLAPDAPVLNWPNKITPADFDHWVEERGHGFAGTWAPEYQALLETHDPGQDPQKGGLLVARTGKGYYIYCGLALYRQLPEGVPGAYRLLANLLSVGKNPGLQGGSGTGK
jgi:LmbE family N-acetylglucosaminyl deacetylase